MAETTDPLVPTGMDDGLDVAVQNCVRAAIALLQARYGMDPRLAYAYLSAATDFDISQVVDVVKGVHARIRKSDFADAWPVTQQPVPDGLVEAFWEYERALMSDDVPTLDRLFAPGPTTLRGDTNGLLVGHDMISAFRGSRGGAPRRQVLETHVQTVDDDHALVVAVTELERGGRGQQTQLWAHQHRRLGRRRGPRRRSRPRPRHPDLAGVGDPLVPPLRPGPLDGESVAVKDLYAVAGQRVGAGNPTWLAEAHVEPGHAWAVGALLDAGAAVRGIARTDEFAYSLAGTNAH